MKQNQEFVRLVGGNDVCVRTLELGNTVMTRNKISVSLLGCLGYYRVRQDTSRMSARQTTAAAPTAKLSLTEDS